MAVVALACNYPGAAGPQALWELALDRRTASLPAPAGRWFGSAEVRGGFLDAPYPQAFDARFFDVSPQEALALDPQQRLLLETGWRALEAAGIAVDPEAQRPVGVFVGISTSDYQWSRFRGPEAGSTGPFTATGLSFAAAAGRLSYRFGFTGPSLSVDTACSSSLVALHLARRAILGGECEAALVAGVNALLAPTLFDCLSALNLLSPDGACRAFDAGANGYVRAEGCGAVVLKRLSAAARDGNRIHAVVLGSAVNQDGRTAGLTAPSGAAQRRVIAAALGDAGLVPGDVDYVEAHGTGTPLGDAIELAALADSYAAGRDPARPLLVGSVKTNIGHLEAGAGVAGLLKAVLALEHGRVPGHPRLSRPTPHLDWDAVALAVPATTAAWPNGDGPRRAGVSSFGFSGTNAHVILEAAPEPPPRPEPPAGAVLLPVSARTEAALGEMCAALADWLEGGERDLWDAAYTLSVGRTAFPFRRAVVGANAAALARELRLPKGADTGPGEAAEAKLAALAARWEEGGEVDWTALFAGRPPRLADLPGHPFHPERHWPEPPPEPAVAPVTPIEAPLPATRGAWLELVARLARKVLGTAEASPLAPDVPLVDQGFTSVLGLELRGALEARTGRALPAGLLYDHPTLDRLADLLAGERGAAASPRRAPPEPPPQTESEFDFLDGLSAEDIAELLEREVDGL